MPTISTFFGIVVQMYWNDHAPPHFHAHYQGQEGLFGITDGRLIAGQLPPGAERLIREWAARHRTELLQNWEQGRMMSPFNAIRGADEE